MGRTKIDELVGNDAEDIVKKIHPDAGRDDAAAETAQSGGNATPAPNIKPFTLQGK